MLAEIRSFSTDRGSIEDMVELLAGGELVLGKFRDLSENGVETPSWLESKLRQIRCELNSRQADYIEKKLADTKIRLANLQENAKTPEDKIAAYQREIESLEALMGKK